jgi:hypothetical protein
MEHNQWAARSFVLSGRLAFCLKQQTVCISKNVAARLLYISRYCGQPQPFVIDSGITVSSVHRLGQLRISRISFQLDRQIPNAGHA